MIRRLNFRSPITTRKGSKIRLYYIYPDRIHGAYEAKEDDWIICSWDNNGYFLEADHRGQPICSLDLINIFEQTEEEKKAG